MTAPAQYIHLVTKLCLVTPFSEALLRIRLTTRSRQYAKQSFAKGRYQAELGNERVSRELSHIQELVRTHQHVAHSGQRLQVRVRTRVTRRQLAQQACGRRDFG